MISSFLTGIGVDSGGRRSVQLSINGTVIEQTPQESRQFAEALMSLADTAEMANSNNGNAHAPARSVTTLTASTAPQKNQEKPPRAPWGSKTRHGRAVKAKKK